MVGQHGGLFLLYDREGGGVQFFFELLSWTGEAWIEAIQHIYICAGYGGGKGNVASIRDLNEHLNIGLSTYAFS